MHTTKLLIVFLLSSLSLFAQCDGKFSFLGFDKPPFNSIDQNVTHNSVIWHQENNGSWSLSNDLDCTKSGYMLLSAPTTPLPTTPYKDEIYTLKKGWNALVSHKDGIDVVKTFSPYAKSIAFVYTYDPLSQLWAGYSPQKELMQKILSTHLLGLKSVEPQQNIYVYAKQEVQINIESIRPNETCQKLVADTQKYAFLVDSGLDAKEVSNKENTMSLRSRYNAHFIRGIYDDTRVMLIYPKLKIKSKKRMNYGPVVPKVALRFAKEYEGVDFYMFDYKDQECYQGLFPSMKKPPVPALKKLSEK
ncbi:MAG: hypothetical protein J7J31_06605 [Helicobacteraceae bacterium]|nr:hypothetical protein [Helicobacteraceae bacterium]